MSSQFAVVERVAMSESDVIEDDEGNVIDLVLPVVAGPFDEPREAEAEAISSEYVTVEIPGAEDDE